MSSEPQTAFLSYCREDQEFALKLAADLKAAGASVWIDQLDIEPGAAWNRSIEDALSSCPRMLVLLSPAAVRSENVQNEIARALRKQKIVIPAVYIRCELPLLLERIQYVDVGADYQRGLSTLVRVLRAAAPHLEVQASVQATQQCLVGTMQEDAVVRGVDARQADVQARAEASRSWFSMWAVAAAGGVIALALFLWWVFSGRHPSEPEASLSQAATVAQAPAQTPSQLANVQPDNAPVAQNQSGSGPKQANGSGTGPKQANDGGKAAEERPKAGVAGADETPAARAFAESAVKMFDAGKCSELYDAFDKAATNLTKDQWLQVCSTALQQRGSVVSRSLGSTAESMGYYRFIFSTQATQGKVFEDIGVIKKSGKWELFEFYVRPNL
jgi:hypothetical protein